MNKIIRKNLRNISDIQNLKREKIADDGRKYVMKNLNNDKATEPLVKSWKV